MLLGRLNYKREVKLFALCLPHRQCSVVISYYYYHHNYKSRAPIILARTLFRMKDRTMAVVLNETNLWIQSSASYPLIEESVDNVNNRIAQLTLEQHGFGLCRFIYTQIFFGSKYHSTAPSVLGCICRSRILDAWEPRTRRVDCKFYGDGWLLQGWMSLTTTLFKGQLQLRTQILEPHYLDSNPSSALYQLHNL